MHVSTEEAVRLFSKWRDESTPLGIDLTTDSEIKVVRFVGTVKDCSDTNVLLVGRSAGDVLAVWIAGSTFGYFEPRDAPRSADAVFDVICVGVLAIAFFSGGKCMVYELSSDWRDVLNDVHG